MKTYARASHFVALLCLSASAGTSERNAGMIVAQNGAPHATIVVAKEATDLQREPAKELQAYLRKITGATLPIADDAQVPRGSLILVGESKLTREMGLDLAKLQGDSFLIKTAPGRLALAGHDATLGSSKHWKHNKRGTANAVSAFLQDYCGVRWFMPGGLGEVVPHTPTLEIPHIDKREAPFRLFARGSFSKSEWAARTFFGTSLFFAPSSCHLWRKLIPVAKYYKAHPEWFALVAGKRVEGDRSHVYLCTTNQEMWAEALKNLEAMYAEGVEAVVLCQADGYRRCQCQRCEATDGYRINGWYLPGTPADRIWVFHDFLARGIHETHPGRKLVMLAYGPTGEVPARLKGLPDNVIVEWCHPTPPAVERWTKFHDQFSVFLYWFTSETRNFLPVSLYHVAAEFNRLARAGAKGFTFCGGNRCWGTNAPTYYLIGRLLRDPNTDEGAVLKEFCEGLFERAALPMERFYETWHGAAARLWKLTPPEQIGKPYERSGKGLAQKFYLVSFPDDVLTACERSLKQAETLANSDAVRRRIRFFRDAFEYTRLTTLGFARLREYQGDRSPQHLAALKEAVRRRNQFARTLHERQKQNAPDLPPLFQTSLDDLLYGARPYKRLATPFRDYAE